MQSNNFFRHFLMGNKKRDKQAIKTNVDIYDLATTIRHEGNREINSDVSGSYTGLSIDSDYPIQDADDL